MVNPKSAMLSYIPPWISALQRRRRGPSRLMSPRLNILPDVLMGPVRGPFPCPARRGFACPREWTARAETVNPIPMPRPRLASEGGAGPLYSGTNSLWGGGGGRTTPPFSLLSPQPPWTHRLGTNAAAHGPWLHVAQSDQQIALRAVVSRTVTTLRPGSPGILSRGGSAPPSCAFDFSASSIANVWPGGRIAHHLDAVGTLTKIGPA